MERGNDKHGSKLDEQIKDEESEADEPEDGPMPSRAARNGESENEEGLFD